MSWSFSMHGEVCPTCGRGAEIDEERNYTYNVSPMFYDALGELENGIRSLNGMTGDEGRPHLERAIMRMTDDPEKYQAMNPKNGWGDYEGALTLLSDLLEWSADYPTATFDVH